MDDFQDAISTLFKDEFDKQLPEGTSGDQCRVHIQAIANAAAKAFMNKYFTVCSPKVPSFYPPQFQK